MQNCELSIKDGDVFELSTTTDRTLREEVASSLDLVEALKKVQSRGWKLEHGTLQFKREGLPELINR
jgi:hypothetical protein